MHSALYLGWLSHRRHGPRPHAFRYGMFMVLLDLAELGTAFRGRWLWSTSRAALARFDRRDHFGDPAVPLDAAVRDLVERQTGERPAGPVRLLTHLRYFGYVFNPVSFYFCFDAAGRDITAIVAEVNNTPWNERHCYVLRPARDGEWLLARSGKAMHVSPFHPMDLEYEWRFRPSPDGLRIAMALRPAGKREAAPLFHAFTSLERVPITARSLAATLLRFPLMTLKVIAAIHWEALRLWLKRVPVHDHPTRQPSPAAPEPTETTR
jgi:DUF1365 family protein